MPSPSAPETRPARRLWLHVTAAVLLASLAGLAGVTVLFARQAERTLRDTQHQADLSTRLRQLQGVMVALVDAEAGQRGFLLTGRESDLAPYSAAVERLPGLLTALDAPQLVDPDFPAKARQAREDIDRKLGELAGTIRLQRAGRHEEALAVVLGDDGERFRTQARRSVNAALDAVRADRDRLATDIADGVQRTKHLLVASVSLLLLFIGVALVQIAQALAARRRFEHRLIHSEQRHRTLVEEQSELVSLALENGTLVYVNPSYARHFGREASQLLGSNLFDGIAPEDLAEVRTQIDAVMRTGEPLHTTNRIVSADGSIKWIAWTDRRQQTPGSLPMLHSVGRDITERKAVEAALKASQVFLDRTGRLAGVGGWEQDLFTGEAFWSDEVRRILEVDDAHQPTVMSVMTSYAPEARPVMHAAIRAAIDHGTPWDLELERTTAKGREIWVRVVGQPEYENGRVRRIVGALQDITERKRLETQLAHKESFVRQITDNLPVRIAYLDAEHRYQFVNEAQCRRFGRAREQIVGRTRDDLTGGTGDPGVHPHQVAALAGEPQRFEFDDEVGGEPRRIEGQLFPDIGGDGRVRGYHAIGIDITERVTTERALRELTAIQDHTSDLIVQTDHRGQLRYMNPAARRAFGIEPLAHIGDRHMSDFLPPETQERATRESLPTARAEGVWLGEATILTAGDRPLPVSHMLIAHHDPDGRTGRYSAVMRDISAQVADRQQLLLQTATLRSVCEAIPAIVAVIGTDERYRFVNSAFEHWAGTRRASIVGQTLEQVLGHAEYQDCRPWIQRALAGDSVSYERCYREGRQDRFLGITYVPLWNANAVEGFIAVAQDITRQKAEEGRLIELAQRDPLTGMLNRNGFEAWLDGRNAELVDGSLALLYVDLDHFKAVNDSHGHPVGDQVLRQFAQRVSRLVRPSDAIARLGGDEFAVVLSGMRERSNAEAVADKIVAAARQPFQVGALMVGIGASVGVAWPEDIDTDWQGLVQRADVNLYRAKAAGRGTRA